MLSSAVPPPIPRSRLLDNHKRAGEPEPRAPGPGGRGERNNKNTGPSPPILTPAKPPVTSATARPPPPAAWKRPSETGELGESEAEAPTRLHKGAVQAPGVEIDPNCNEPAVPCLCCEPQPPHQPHAPPHDQNHNHNHNRNRHYSQQLDNNNTVAQPQPPPQRQQSPPLSRESRESTGEEEEEEEEEEDVDVDEEEEEEEDDEDDTLVPSCADCPPSLLALSLSSSSSSISSCSDFESDSPDPLSPAASPPDACADLFPGAGRPPHIVPLELPPQSPDEGYPSAHSSHSTSPDHKSILTAALPLAPPELRDKRGEEEEEEEAPVPDSLAPSPLQPSPPLETSPPGLEASSSSSSLTSASLTPSLFSSPSPSPPSLEPNGNTVPSLPPLPPPRHRRRFLALGGSSAVASGPAPLRKPGNAWKVAPPPPSTAPPPSFLALDAEIRRLVEMAGLSRQELPGLGPELSWEGEGEGEGVGIRERERGREGEGLGIGEREGEEERVGKGEREEDRVAGGQGTEEREGEGEGDGAVRPVPRLSAPPRKTSFHEIALRRKRANNNNSSNNNNSNNCTFGPAPRPSVAPPRPPPPVPARPPLPPRPSLPLAARPDRSDWLILFSPDTEFPPRPFGSGQREPSPQKPAGTKVTTFKELRNRSKQQGSAGQNPFALEPEPGPAPLTPDPDFLYSCQSELYAEFRPLPQPAPPTTHAPPQPPSSLDGQQLHPGALQPIAEGASEPESRPPLRIGSSSSDGSLRTVGSGGERQREGEGERDGERERERWGERGRADGGRSWEPRTTAVSSRPLSLSFSLRPPLRSPYFLHQRGGLPERRPPSWRVALQSRETLHYPALPTGGRPIHREPDRARVGSRTFKEALRSPDLATGGRQALLPWDPEAPVSWSSDSLTPPQPVPPRLSPVGAYSPPQRDGTPPPGADRGLLCSPLFPRSRTLPSLALGPAPAPQAPGPVPHTPGPPRPVPTRRTLYGQPVRSLSFAGTLQGGGARMLDAGRTPLGDQELTRLCLLEKRGLVSAVSVAVEAVLAQFSSSRTQVQKAQSGDSSMNPPLARVVLQCLCPALRHLLSDGLKPHQSDLIAGRRRNSPWGLVQASTRPGPCTQALYSLQCRVASLSQLRLSTQRFNAFLLGLLNLKLLDFWFSHLQSCDDVLAAHYSPASFLSLSRTSCQPLFEELLLLLQPLSLLTFHLDLLFEHHHLDPASPAYQGTLGIVPGEVESHKISKPQPCPANQGSGPRLGMTSQGIGRLHKNGLPEETANCSPVPGALLFRERDIDSESEGAPPSVGRLLSQGWGSLLRWGGRLGQSLKTPELPPQDACLPARPSGSSSDPLGFSAPLCGIAPPGTESRPSEGQPEGSEGIVEAPSAWLGRLFGATRGNGPSHVPPLEPKMARTPARRPSSWLSPGVSTLSWMMTPALSPTPERGSEGEVERGKDRGGGGEKPQALRAVRALCDHQGLGAELSFRKGEELLLVGGVDEEWIRCRQGDREGLVPIGYASLIL